jgi:hypothetical protein
VELNTIWTFTFVNQRLGVTVKPTATASGTHVGGCNPSGWVSWFFNVQKELDNVFNAQVQRVAMSFAQSWNLPQSFSPFQDVFIVYNITDILWTTADHLEVRANASLLVSIDNHNVTFEADAVDAAISPPVGWNARASNDSSLNLMSGTRVSAWMWVAERTSKSQCHSADYGCHCSRVCNLRSAQD